MLAPIRTVAPETAPISLLEAKAHLRVDFEDGDTLITSLIDAATAHVDGWTGVLGRALVTQTLRQDFSRFTLCLRLSLAPASSITSITYYDGDNVQQTLSADIYQLLTDGRGPFISPKPDQVWPGSYGREDAVSITYVAGFGDAGIVPAPIRAALLLIVGHLYETARQPPSVSAPNCCRCWRRFVGWGRLPRPLVHRVARGHDRLARRRW